MQQLVASASSASPVPISPRQPLIAAIRAYQRAVSPWLGPRCRFHPSCSSYAIEAMERFGGARGSVLALFRVARCHPFCEGGVDPVPDIFPRRPWRRAAPAQADALDEAER